MWDDPKGRRYGQPRKATFPDLRTGREMMAVIGADVESDKAGRRVAVQR